MGFDDVAKRMQSNSHEVGYTAPPSADDPDRILAERARADERERAMKMLIVGIIVVIAGIVVTFVGRSPTKNDVDAASASGLRLYAYVAYGIGGAMIVRAFTRLRAR